MSASPSPDLDAEQEVDLGRYASAVADRWWLPVLGLLAGALVGYLLSLGGTQVYRAQALVYLGQPYSANGSAPVQSLATSPSFVRQTVKSEATVKRAAREADMPVSKLRGGISAAPVAATGAAARAGQTQLWSIAVQGAAPGKVAAAANALAALVISRVAGYVDDKLRNLNEQIAGYEEELASLEERIDAATALGADRRVSAVERLVALNTAGLLEQRRASVREDRLAARGLIAQAENVERPRVVDPASPRKTTARSKRNSMIAAAALGLLLGLAAALLWDRLGARTERRRAI